MVLSTNRHIKATKCLSIHQFLIMLEISTKESNNCSQQNSDKVLGREVFKIPIEKMRKR